MLCKLSKKRQERYMIRLILTITLTVTCFYTWSKTSCDSTYDIAWMAGNWQQQKSNKQSTKVAKENWQQVSKDTFEGQGFTLDSQGKIVFQESLRMVRMQQQWFYLAKVKDNKLPIAFEAVQCANSFVQFKNTQHDFPQLLSYSLKNGLLTIEAKTIDGKGFSLVMEK